MATFRRIELRVELTSSYGRYVVSAHYKGEDIKAVTTDAEIYDWLDDDSNREKHRWAKRAAYELIVREYKQNKSNSKIKHHGSINQLQIPKRTDHL